MGVCGSKEAPEASMSKVVARTSYGFNHICELDDERLVTAGHKELRVRRASHCHRHAHA